MAAAAVAPAEAARAGAGDGRRRRAILVVVRFLATKVAVAAAASWLVTGCSSSACDKAIDELAPLRPNTIKAAPPDVVGPWEAKILAARATCIAEKHPEQMDRIAEVETAITLRAADFAIEAGEKAALARSASAKPPPPPVWTVHCADVVHDRGFHGLLPEGMPRNVAGFLVPDGAAPRSADALDAGAPAPPPQAALVLGGRPVYLSARGGKLEGSSFDGSRFTPQQSLGWPPEAARQGVAAERIVAAHGEGTLAIAWIADLRVFFAVLELASERWTALSELAISGDDGGRDLKLGDLTWGRSTFGLVLATASGFAFAEIVPDGRLARPARLQSAFVAGAPRIAWSGQEFMIAAGKADGSPSMGIWRAPTGSAAATFLTLLDAVPSGASVQPLTGELLAKDGAVHVAFRVRVSPTESATYLGHADEVSHVQLESCEKAP